MSSAAVLIGALMVIVVVSATSNQALLLNLGNSRQRPYEPTSTKCMFFFIDPKTTKFIKIALGYN